MEGKRISDSKVTLTKLMLPSDANLQGNVHGGVVMSLVDQAGAIVAARHSRQNVVTAVIDSMTFLTPVHIGDLVIVEAALQYVGRTSMEVAVKVEAEKWRTGERSHTSSAYAVYVALDEQGNPTPIPPLILETEEEKRNWEAAKARQALRLRMRPSGSAP